MNKRSTGVTLIAWLYLIAGGWSIISLFRLKGQIAAYSSNFFNLPSYYFPAMYAQAIVSGTLSLLVAFALFKLKPWAKTSIYLQLGVAVLITLVFFFVFTYAHVIPYLQSQGYPTFFVYLTPLSVIAWAGFMIYFFNRSSIKEQFAENNEQPNQSLESDD